MGHQVTTTQRLWAWLGRNRVWFIAPVVWASITIALVFLGLHAGEHSCGAAC